MGASGNHWYHCIVSTYGTWVRGDARGWRSRHHREHVQGDYRHPPVPGTYDQWHRRSLASMLRPPVILSIAQRQAVCLVIARCLDHDQILFVDGCVSATHFHWLLRLPPEAHHHVPGLVRGNALQDGRDPLPRHLLGRVKMHASRALKQMQLWDADSGGLWAKRSKVIPIRDRAHQLNVVRYIRGHEGEGAAVWSILNNLNQNHA